MCRCTHVNAAAENLHRSYCTRSTLICSFELLQNDFSQCDCTSHQLDKRDWTWCTGYRNRESREFTVHSCPAFAWFCFVRWSFFFLHFIREGIFFFSHITCPECYTPSHSVTAVIGSKSSSSGGGFGVWIWTKCRQTSSLLTLKFCSSRHTSPSSVR